MQRRKHQIAHFKFKNDSGSLTWISFYLAQNTQYTLIQPHGAQMTTENTTVVRPDLLDGP